MKKLVMIVIACSLILCSSVAAIALPVLDGRIRANEYADLFVEDSNTYQVGPGYGGQAYDAEKLGLTATSSTIYFGLKTGLEIEPGLAATSGYERPGDLLLDLNGDNAFDYAIRFWKAGGAIYGNINDWRLPSAYPDSGPWRAIASKSDNLGKFTRGVFRSEGVTDRYGLPSNIFEGYVTAADLGLANFDSYSSITAKWTMHCGNDFAEIATTPMQTAPVPEPATMILLGTGLAGLAGLKRRKK